MPRLKRVSKSQQREKKKVQKRLAREEGEDKEGLIFPPEKSESESECSRNGLNFPKKSENGLNFPKKAESAEEGWKLPAKCCADSVPKPVSDADEKKGLIPGSGSHAKNEMDSTLTAKVQCIKFKRTEKKCREKKVQR